MIKVLCYGDSNTYGYKPFDERHEIRYPLVLRHKLGSSYMVYEEGLNGRTSIYNARFEERIGINTVDDVFLKYDSIDLLVFMLGTNDLKITNARTIEEYFNGLDLLLSRIVELKRIKKLLLVSPIFIKEKTAFPDFDEKSAELSKRSIHVYNRLAQKYHANLIDAALICSPGMDGVHLSLEDHIKLGLKLAYYISNME